MRNEVTIGGILGLVLGGLVIFGLAHESAPAVPASGPLAPLELSDCTGLDDHESTSTDGGHRPVRPGSQRLHDGDLAQS